MVVQGCRCDPHLIGVPAFCCVMKKDIVLVFNNRGIRKSEREEERFNLIFYEIFIIHIVGCSYFFGRCS